MVSPAATVALAMALAVGCYPAEASRARLASVLPTLAVTTGAAGSLFDRLNRVLGGPQRVAAALVPAALFGAVAGGIGGAIAAAMVAGLGAHRVRRAQRQRRRAREVAALADAIGVMAAELRAGAHPAAAAVTAADTTAPPTAAAAGRFGSRWLGSSRADGGAAHRVLVSVAAGARLGAEVPALFERHAGAEPAIADQLHRVAAAWSLAERHGVALAELMEAVRSDLDARVRLAGQVSAQLAGPRATAGVLAVLPAVGVLLGQGIGADPWRVLTATPAGQALLAVGTAMACAGVVWSGRITDRAVAR
jgi:tight adherence protein B